MGFSNRNKVEDSPSSKLGRIWPPFFLGFGCWKHGVTWRRTVYVRVILASLSSRSLLHPLPLLLPPRFRLVTPGGPSMRSLFLDLAPRSSLLVVSSFRADAEWSHARHRDNLRRQLTSRLHRCLFVARTSTVSIFSSFRPFLFASPSPAFASLSVIIHRYLASSWKVKLKIKGRKL